MFKKLFVVYCLLFIVYSVHGETNTVDVGKNTQEVVENSNQLQPEALKSTKSDTTEACGLAELFCLFTPKAKFVQEKTVSNALLPKDEEEKNFFQKFSEFFTRIWGYSSDEKAGYINAGTPNDRLKYNDLGAGEFGIDTRNSTEFAHTNYLESMLPAALQKNVKYNEAQEPEEDTSTAPSSKKSSKDSKTPLSKLVYFNQKDPQWSSISGKKVCEYKDDGRPIYETIGNSGCGPTSVAMIVSGYKDASVTPVDTWEIMTKRGQTQCATGMGANQSLLEEYGLKTGGQWESCGTSNPRVCEQQMRKYLEVPGSERVLMVLAFLKKDDKGQCSWGGHYFNIVGFDEDGEPLIYDPYYGSDAAPQRRSELSYQCVNYLNFLVVETK